MTTIVGDWQRKILVSDTQFSDDDTGMKYHDDKVYKIPNGWLGGAGHKADIEKVLAFITGKLKRKPKLRNQNSLIMLTKDGLFTSDSSIDWESVDKFIAIGSGAMAAEALMRHGYSAEASVAGACDTDLYSSEPIKVYSLESSDPTTWNKE
jgi:ATP-dependent protease HslVU (ClpYQ) peptidase subunit